MSAAQAISTSVPEESYILALTFRACQMAAAAADSAADALSSTAAAKAAGVAECERELDRLDRELDERLAASIAGAAPHTVREMLACMKFMIDLERVGDLLVSFAGRAEAVRLRLEMQDVRDLVQMTQVLATMLADVYRAFSTRDVNRALGVLRADGELDRLRNLVLMRHLDPGSTFCGPDSIHVVCMAQSLERAGDHAKNLAEEVCHLVTGHSVRHLLKVRDLPSEQLYLEHLRRQHRA
jgi:phosphate transport system protein